LPKEKGHHFTGNVHVYRQRQRAALLLLASIPFGATDAAISANGISRLTLARLIRAGLATAQREIKTEGKLSVRVRITEAGPRVLEG
jgi:hypothetical protein